MASLGPLEGPSPFAVPLPLLRRCRSSVSSASTGHVAGVHSVLGPQALVHCTLVSLTGTSGNTGPDYIL